MSRKTVLLITFSQLVSYTAPLITFPLLIKALGITHYGIWIEASTIIGLVVIFCFAGLINSIGLMVANHTANDHTIYANGLYVFWGLGLLLMLSVYLLSPYLNSLTARDLVGLQVLQFASGLILVWPLQLLAGQIFRMKNKVVMGATFEILITVARLIAVILGAIIQNVIDFAAIYLLLQIVIFLPMLFIAYSDLKLETPSLKIMRNIVKTGMNLAVVNQSEWLVMYGDRLMLSILSISAAVAIYSASYQLTQILVALGWPYLYALLPILGNHWKTNDIRGMQSAVLISTRAMFILLVPSVVGLTLTGNTLLKFLATEDFAQGAILVGMIASGMAVQVVSGNLQYLFYAQGRPQVLRNIYVQAAVFNIVANLVAIPLFSYNGAGLTTLLTFVYVFYRMWKKTEMPFNSLFDMSVFWRCLLVSAVMGVWVALTIAPTIVGLGVAIVGGALIYGVGLLLLRVITLDDVLAIPKAVMRRFAS